MLIESRAVMVRRSARRFSDVLTETQASTGLRFIALARHCYNSFLDKVFNAPSRLW